MFNMQQTIQNITVLLIQKLLKYCVCCNPRQYNVSKQWHNQLKQTKKPPYMFSWVWLLRAIRSCRLGSMSCPALLGQLYDHGSQLGWVSADGCISNGWSNGANAQHQRAAIIIRRRKALVAHAWLRARAPIVDRRCRSIHMVLKKTRDFMLESHKPYVLFL